MNADTVFRFVAVRPPRRAPDTAPPLEEEIVAREVATEIHRTSAAERAALDQVHLRWGAAFIESPSYFRKEPSASRLRGRSAAAKQLVRDMTQTPDRAAFAARLGEIVPPPLRAGQPWTALVATFWRSYYATVLNPYRLPEDRAELAAWLRLFYLTLGVEDDADFRRRAAGLDRKRPRVPRDFFEPREIFIESAGGIEAPVPSRTTILAQTIERLRAARLRLQEIHAEKLRTFETPAPVPAPDGRPRARGGVELDRAPWRLTRADLADRPEVQDALDDAGLRVDGQPLPLLLAALDQRVATLLGEKEALTRRTSVKSAGASWVRGRT